MAGAVFTKLPKPNNVITSCFTLSKYPSSLFKILQYLIEIKYSEQHEIKNNGYNLKNLRLKKKAKSFVLEIILLLKKKADINVNVHKAPIVIYDAIFSAYGNNVRRT